MHTLCCGKATPPSHAHCRPGALCAARLRKRRASGLPGGGCCAIAMLQVMTSRVAATQIAVAMRCPAQGDRRNAKARRVRPRCDALGSARRHAQMSPGAIAELGMCHVQRVRCGLRHASGSGPPMRILRHTECAGVCERCSALQALVGGSHRLSVAGRGRWHAKKNGGRSTGCDHRERPARVGYLVARRAYLLRIDICGLSLPSLPGCTVKKYSGFHHAPAAHQVQPSHTSLFFSM
ncbi:hypothetical protein CPBF367_00290 [Xanthomonas arboricola pv. juglandis]|nr:hypothetical protein CPBF367_00290 [Xanthomonas arboricola pv. juglandis]